MDTQTTSHLGYEREWERRKELEQDVLVHLTESGSAKKWGAIYSHFYQDERGEIGETLSHLVHRKHLAIESDGTARITAAGTEQLKNSNRGR